MSSLSQSSRIRSHQQLFEWEQFEANIYMTFFDAFTKEVEGVFSQLDFWTAFTILDPRALREELDLLDDKFDVYNGDESHQKAGLKPEVNQAEWNSLISMMF